MLLVDLHLEIKKSTIPRAGKGLFTRIFIAKGTPIVEHKGRISTWNEANHDDGKNVYIYYVSRHHVIDARDHPKSLGRFINDSKGPYATEGMKNNAEYVQVGKRVFIKSTKDIPAGSEILVAYGKSYWDVLRKNKVIPDLALK